MTTDDGAGDGGDVPRETAADTPDEEAPETGERGSVAGDDVRVSAGLDIRAVFLRSAGYAVVASLVAFAIHTTGTVRGLGHPEPAVAAAVNAGRAGGTFAVAYPVILALNTVGRRVGATRRLAARTRSPTLVYVAITVAVTVVLFLPVIQAIAAGTSY